MIPSTLISSYPSVDPYATVYCEGFGTSQLVCISQALGIPLQTNTTPLSVVSDPVHGKRLAIIDHYTKEVTYTNPQGIGTIIVIRYDEWTYGLLMERLDGNTYRCIFSNSESYSRKILEL